MGEIKAVQATRALQDSFHTRTGDLSQDDDFKFAHLVQLQEAHRAFGLELMEERTLRHFTRAEPLEEPGGFPENVQCRLKLGHKK